MTRTEIIRTGPYMTHFAVTNPATGEVVGTACAPRKLPKRHDATDEKHVVCNRCTGAHRSGARLGR